MIHLAYFAVGLLVLIVAAVIPFVIGLGVCSVDAMVSKVKLPRFSYGSYWLTGSAFITLILFIYFMGALFYMGCGK
jgi:hypothetical protein